MLSSPLLARRLSFSSFLPSSLRRHGHHQFSSSTQPHGQGEVPFLAQYLISALNFPRDRAIKVSADNRVAGIKSEDRPQSVVRFLRDTGLSDAQIGSVVSFCPYLLTCDVENKMRPMVRALTEAGFSGELLIRLIQKNPSVLYSIKPLSHLLFWRDFVGGCDEVLLKIVQKNSLLLSLDIDKSVLPRINLLNEYGFSNQDIIKLLAHRYSNLTKSLDGCRQNLQFIEDLGIPRGSRMFLLAFRSLGACNKDKLLRKVELLKMMYGWSQEEVSSAFKKSPIILALSVDKIQAGMNFLIRKAMLEPRSIASCPILLSFSLEKRLAPRHRVLGILAAKGLMKNWSLSSACHLTERDFFERFVEPYRKTVPELADAYSGTA